jgi:aldose 1-epimerase
MKILSFSFLFIALLMGGCKTSKQSAMSVDDKIWGEADGKTVHLVTLTNANKMQVKITNFGGIVNQIVVPDKNGKFENIVLGFDSLAPYEGDIPYFGAIVGRYGNRIAKGKFTLNGTEYTLAVNNGVNHLHGGLKGFNKRVFELDTAYAVNDSAVVSLSYLSADMEEGYPGNLRIKITYTLTNNNELKIGYEAETDKPTVLNLTNHSYFNLTACKENVLNHELVLPADSITPTDSTLIPTGVLQAVAGTPFDFTTAHKIGERIDQVPGGYDVNYKLRNKTGQYVQAAEVYEPVSGRLLQAYTTEPGVQFYSGNFLNGTITGFNNTVYQKHFGFCLEMQHFPDSPNHPQFPSVVLNPGEKYTQHTMYRFSTR